MGSRFSLLMTEVSSLCVGNPDTRSMPLKQRDSTHVLQSTHAPAYRRLLNAREFGRAE